MKKLIIIIFLTFNFIPFSNAQKLAEDKIDKFTKVSVKRTEWYPFTKKRGTMRPTESSYRISKLGETVYFDLRMTLNNEVYSINDGDEIMFLMQNDSVVSIKNLKYELTGQGKGAVGYVGSANLGTETSYIITKDVYNKLTAGTIKMVRIYTSLGYIEYEVKPGLDKGIKNLLMIVQ